MKKTKKRNTYLSQRYFLGTDSKKGIKGKPRNRLPGFLFLLFALIFSFGQAQDLDAVLTNGNTSSQSAGLGGVELQPSTNLGSTNSVKWAGGSKLYEQSVTPRFIIQPNSDRFEVINEDASGYMASFNGPGSSQPNRTKLYSGVLIGSGSNYAGNGTPPENGLLVEGNVGLGTPSPQYKLDVAGDINASGAFRVNGVALSEANPKVKVVPSGFDWANIPASYANSIWEIQYDFDLTGIQVTLPENVTLKYRGGSTKDFAELIGNNTKIDANEYHNIFGDGGGVIAGFQRTVAYPSWFGAETGSITDTSKDNRAALNALFGFCYDNLSDAFLTPGVYRISGPIIVQKGGVNSFTVSGKSTPWGSDTMIWMDADVTLPENKIMCKTLGGSMRFNDISFHHNDEHRNKGTHIFYLTHFNPETKQDIDNKYFRCLFYQVENAIEVYGRGIDVNDCDFSKVRNAVTVSWPDPFDNNNAALGPEGKLTTGFRSYRIRNNKVHASAGGYLFTNRSYNRHNLYNVEITGNDLDTPMGVLNGSLKNSQITGNTFAQMENNFWLKLGDGTEGDKLENVIISNNVITGVNTSELKKYMWSIFDSTDGTGNEIDNVIFSNNTIANVSRSVFSLFDCKLNGFKISDNTFDDILEGNDTSPSRDFLISTDANSLYDLSVTGNRISGFERTFNRSTLFNIQDVAYGNVTAHSNTTDSDTIPLFSIDFNQNVGQGEFSTYVGNGGTQTIYLDVPIKGVFVSVRNTANSVMTLRGGSSALNGVKVAPDGSFVQLEGDFNEIGTDGYIYYMR